MLFRAESLKTLMCLRFRLSIRRCSPAMQGLPLNVVRRAKMRHWLKPVHTMILLRSQKIFPKIILMMQKKLLHSLELTVIGLMKRKSCRNCVITLIMTRLTGGLLQARVAAADICLSARVKRVRAVMCLMSVTKIVQASFAICPMNRKKILWRRIISRAMSLKRLIPPIRRMTLQ